MTTLNRVIQKAIKIWDEQNEYVDVNHAELDRAAPPVEESSDVFAGLRIQGEEKVAENDAQLATVILQHPSLTSQNKDLKTLFSILKICAEAYECKTPEDAHKKLAELTIESELTATAKEFIYERSFALAMAQRDQHAHQLKSEQDLKSKLLDSARERQGIIDQQERTLDTVADEFLAREQQHQRDQDKIGKLESEIRRLTSNLREYTEEQIKLDAIIEGYDSRERELREQKALLSIDLAEQREKTGETQAQVRSLQDQLQQQKEALRHLEELIAGQQDIMAEKGATIRSLQALVADQRSALVSRVIQPKELQTRSKLEHLQSELNAQAALIEETQRAHQELEKQYKAVLAELKARSEENSDLRDRNKSLFDENRKYKRTSHNRRMELVEAKKETEKEIKLYLQAANTAARLQLQVQALSERVRASESGQSFFAPIGKKSAAKAAAAAAASPNPDRSATPTSP